MAVCDRMRSKFSFRFQLDDTEGVLYNHTKRLLTRCQLKVWTFSNEILRHSAVSVLQGSRSHPGAGWGGGAGKEKKMKENSRKKVMGRMNC